MKKNSVLGELFWLIYSAAALFSFCYIAMVAAVRLGYSAPTGLAAVGGVLLAAAVVNALLQAILRRCRKCGKDLIKPAVAEGIGLVAVLAGTLVWRILTFGQAALGEYYEAAKVVSINSYDPDVASGAVELYLRLLHGVLWVFGNTSTSVYVLQLILFFCLMLVYYFSVRSLCGAGMGLLATALLGASPLLGERFLADAPELLFCLVFFAAYLGIVTWWDRWNRFQEQRSLPMTLCRCLVTGGLIGVGVYLDATAFLLVPILVCVLLCGRKPAVEGSTDFVYGFWNRRPSVFLFMLVFGLAACIGLFYAFVQSPTDWLAQYTDISLRLPVWMTASPWDPWGWEIVTVLGLTSLGVFAVRNQCHATDSGLLGRTCLLLCALLLTVLQCYGIAADAPMDSYLLLYLFLLAFAGMSLADLFVPRMRDAAESETETAEAKQPETGAAEAEETGQSEKPEQTTETAQAEESAQSAETGQSAGPEKLEPAQVIFLESPLPLPKKHVRKTMDYDIEVAEDDDYDIP